MSHGYWRLEQERILLAEKAKESADLIRSKGLEQAREIGKMEREWRDLKEKLTKIDRVLAPFNPTYRKVEIKGGE